MNAAVVATAQKLVTPIEAFERMPNWLKVGLITGLALIAFVVVRVTGPDVPGVPYNHYNHVLEDWFMPSPDRIADAVRRLAAY